MATRTPRRCTQCRNMATHRGRCDNHQPKPWKNPSANTRTLTGHQRATFREHVLRAANYECQNCGHPATEADHIIEIADGGHPTDWETNGQALCTACHQSKTATYKKIRRRKTPKK